MMKSPIVVLVGAGAFTRRLTLGARADPLSRGPVRLLSGTEVGWAIYTLAREARGVIKREMAASDTTIGVRGGATQARKPTGTVTTSRWRWPPPFLQALACSSNSSNLDARCDRYGTLVDELLKLQTDAVFRQPQLRHAARQSTRRILAAQLDERLHRNARSAGR